MKKLLTTNDLCEYFSVCRITVERWRKQGLPFIIIGTRSVRFDMEEVLKWVGNMNKEKLN